jgi:hypothetical protein
MKEITSLGVSPSPEACGITVDDGLAGRRARMATNFPLPVQSGRTAYAHHRPAMLENTPSCCISV